MFIKFKKIRERFRKAVVFSPVEAVVSSVYFLTAVVSYYQHIGYDDFLGSFPICFCLIYAVNRFSRGTGWRWLYYISVLSIGGFWVWNLRLTDSIYWMTLIVSQLLVLLSARAADNDAFVRNGLCYVRNMVAATVLALVGWLLAWAIYASVTYIFDLSANYRIMVYISQGVWFMVAPILFLMFGIRQNQEFIANSFLDVLLNFIVTPALMIYNLILYLYFVKIAVVWSLPKGGVAYMVLAFILLLLAVKSIQPVLRRRYYDWYYRFFSLWVVLPLAMLWISVLFRVGEYGWTEWRVYLMLSACMATFTAVLFMIPRWSNYKWVVLGVLATLAVFTYIPGINAGDLGLRSQENRIRTVLYPETGERWNDGTDSVVSARYMMLYNSSRYVQSRKSAEYMRERFGFDCEYLEENIPEKVKDDWGWNGVDDEMLYLVYPYGATFDISGFDSLRQILNNAVGGGVYYEFEDNRFRLISRSDTLVDADIHFLLKEKLAEVGVDTTGGLSQEQVGEFHEFLCTYDIGRLRVIFGEICIDEKDMAIISLSPRFLLTRKKMK